MHQHVQQLVHRHVRQVECQRVNQVEHRRANHAEHQQRNRLLCAIQMHQGQTVSQLEFLHPTVSHPTILLNHPDPVQTEHLAIVEAALPGEAVQIEEEVDLVAVALEGVVAEGVNKSFLF